MTAYEMRISDWSSDVFSSDLLHPLRDRGGDPVGGAPAVLRHPPADRPYHQRARSGADCGLWLSPDQPGPELDAAGLAAAPARAAALHHPAGPSRRRPVDRL